MLIVASRGKVAHRYDNAQWVHRTCKRQLVMLLSSYRSPYLLIISFAQRPARVFVNVPRNAGSNAVLRHLGTAIAHAGWVDADYSRIFRERIAGVAHQKFVGEAPSRHVSECMVSDTRR